MRLNSPSRRGIFCARARLDYKLKFIFEKGFSIADRESTCIRFIICDIICCVVAAFHFAFYNSRLAVSLSLANALLVSLSLRFVLICIAFICRLNATKQIQTKIRKCQMPATTELSFINAASQDEAYILDMVGFFCCSRARARVN